MKRNLGASQSMEGVLTGEGQSNIKQKDTRNDGVR